MEGGTNSRIHHFLPECIAFNQSALRQFVPECIAPLTTRGCLTRRAVVFFRVDSSEKVCSDFPVKRCEGDGA